MRYTFEAMQPLKVVVYDVDTPKVQRPADLDLSRQEYIGKGCLGGALEGMWRAQQRWRGCRRVWLALHHFRPPGGVQSLFHGLSGCVAGETTFFLSTVMTSPSQRLERPLWRPSDQPRVTLSTACCVVVTAEEMSHSNATVLC